VETIDLPEFVVPNGFLATPGIGYVLQSTAKATHVIGATRFRRVCPASATNMELELVGRARLGEIHAMPFWPKDNLYTAFSLSAILSGHWPSNEVALEHSAQEELFKGPIYATQGRRPPQYGLNGRMDETEPIIPGLGPARRFKNPPKTVVISAYMDCSSPHPQMTCSSCARFSGHWTEAVGALRST